MLEAASTPLVGSLGMPVIVCLMSWPGLRFDVLFGSFSRLGLFIA